MARPILGEDRPDRPEAPPIGGGNIRPKDVMGYRPPYGPLNVGRDRPGLGGNTYRCGSQGHGLQPGQDSGSPGNDGSIYRDGIDNDDAIKGGRGG